MLVLYILVRTDMDSLGRGKSVAQGAHAANQFMWDEVFIPAANGGKANEEALLWAAQAKGFGTTLVLDAKLTEMERAVKIANAVGLKASLVADPEYPLLDGKTFFVIPDVVTTAYIFGEKDDCAIATGGLNLLRNDPV